MNTFLGDFAAIINRTESGNAPLANFGKQTSLMELLFFWRATSNMMMMKKMMRMWKHPFFHEMLQLLRLSLDHCVLNVDPKLHV